MHSFFFFKIVADFMLSAQLFMEAPAKEFRTARGAQSVLRRLYI